MPKQKVKKPDPKKKERREKLEDKFTLLKYKGAFAKFNEIKSTHDPDFDSARDVMTSYAAPDFPYSHGWIFKNGEKVFGYRNTDTEIFVAYADLPEVKKT